jgi:hypothetical protein
MTAKSRSAEGRRTGETTPRTGEKAVLSVRMPMELATFIQEEARARALAAGVAETEIPEPGDRALNLSRMVNTILDAFRTYFSLPVVLVERLEADRKALKLGRLDYLQHIVYMRSELIVKNGPGFDKSGAPAAKSGGGRT